MICKADILKKLSDLKPILHRDYAVKEIGLFGSFSDDSYTDVVLHLDLFKWIK